jgi:hypothetical protein
MPQTTAGRAMAALILTVMLLAAAFFVASAISAPGLFVPEYEPRLLMPSP